LKSRKNEGHSNRPDQRIEKLIDCIAYSMAKRWLREQRDGKVPASKKRGRKQKAGVPATARPANQSN
jgi:hypothetical protein